jgi:hypothetical protein
MVELFKRTIKQFGDYGRNKLNNKEKEGGTY